VSAIDPETGKQKRGPPDFPPTDEQRKEVGTLAKYGVRQDTIAAAMGMSVNTLKKWCAAELAQGRAQGDVILQETQFQRAVRDGDVGMLRWLGIHRLGQVERTEVRINKFDGMTNGELIERIRALQHELRPLLEAPGADGNVGGADPEVVN